MEVHSLSVSLPQVTPNPQPLTPWTLLPNLQELGIEFVWLGVLITMIDYWGGNF